MRQIILSIREVTAVLHISYNNAYEVFMCEDFPKFWLFRTYCVRVDHLYDWMKNHNYESMCPRQWAEAFDKKEIQSV